MSNYNIIHALRTNYVLEGALYKYKIKKTLGQGSFGITYLANVQMKGKLGTLDSNMTVAIKEFYMRDINGRDGETVTSGNKGGLFDDYKKKFEREATNLSKLEHPNIVKVLESFEANGTIYYVMEYIDGVSLDKKIEEKKRLDYKICIKYSKQIGSALAFMHKEHMLHLDVKPANIMLRNSDDAVLIDFGLSKQYDENGEPESSTKVGGGTPGYAPLEQANYHEGKDFPVVMDVYALGGTMFKMLSGCRPPEASDILNEGFPAKDLEKVNVPHQLIGCIEKAMHPTKKNRYQTITSFIDAVESVMNELETLEETTVEVFVDDVPDIEAEIVDVPKTDTRTYQVHVVNNRQLLPSVTLNDRIPNIHPDEGQVDIDKNFTYQQVLNGDAGRNIVAELRGETIELTYRFSLEEKSIKFVFKEGNKEIPFTEIMPVLEFDGMVINIPRETFLFQGKEIYGPKRIKSRGTDYRIKRESEDLDLRRLQDTCIVQVEHCFSIRFFFNQPEDKPKHIVFKSNNHGRFPFPDVKNHLDVVLPGYPEEYSYTIESLYYERESGYLATSGTQIQLPKLKPSKNTSAAQNEGLKPSDANSNTKIIRDGKRVRYYYGIGAVILLIIVALYWGLIRPIPNNSEYPVKIETANSPSLPSSVISHINEPRLYNNSYYWEGNWEDEKPNGNGTITYPSDDKDGRKEYKGNVSKGLRNDNAAVLTYTNGNSYTGSFVNDKLNKGKLILKSDGMYFEGSFKDNQPYNGKWYYTDGSLYSTVTNGVEK